MWKSKMAGGEETRKDFHIVLIHQDKKFFTSELSKVIQDAIPLILHYRIPGGKNLSKRQTVFFTSVDPMNKEHRLSSELRFRSIRSHFGSRAISCSNVHGVFFPVHERFWFCLVQVSTTQFCCFPPILFARASDGTDVPVSPLPTSSSNMGSPNGSLPDLEGTVEVSYTTPHIYEQKTAQTMATSRTCLSTTRWPTLTLACTWSRTSLRPEHLSTDH